MGRENKMHLIFVHGWSVTDTDTYGGLPWALSNAAQADGLDLDIQHIYLGRYISFHDEVTLDDISRAMDCALRDLPGNSNDSIDPFSCITHSTGGPMVRHWVDRFYGADGLDDLPLKHLVMLAPANHGSTLGKLGKARVGRLMSWFQGVEPGQRVLDWLCLGSDGQWSLNLNYLAYSYGSHDFYPFVLTGQGIDHGFYDFLNNYLVEDGSDGVVRVAGANMNYRHFSLIQDVSQEVDDKPDTYALVANQDVRVSKPIPLGVYGDYSHSGDKKGIMKSIDEDRTNAPIVADILKCLKVNNGNEYGARAGELKQLTEQQQNGTNRFCMLVFNIHDDQGERVKENDYDLFLLAGNDYRPEKLPKGFFKDKQMNDKTGRLVYYLNANKMGQLNEFGIRVVARPEKGEFSYYCAAEFRSDGVPADHILQPNETTYVDITLHRFVDEEVCRFDPATDGTKSFKKTKPSGNPLGNR
jgi:hypothetical protein